MICKKCGNILQDDDIFCQNCGQKVEEDAMEETAEEKQIVENGVSAEENPGIYEMNSDAEDNEDAAKAATEEQTAEYGSAAAVLINDANKFKKILIPVIIGVAVIILAVIFSILFSSVFSKSNAASEGVVCFDDSENAITYLVNNGKIVNKISESLLDYSFSMDGSCGVLVTNDGTLYYFDSKELKKIDSDLEQYGSSFEISADGSAAVYIKDGTLYVYTVSNGKNTHIAEDVLQFTTSPNGSAVLYNTYNDDKETVCYIYCNGNTTKIDGKNTRPIAIADNAKYVYYLKSDSGSNALYVYADNDSTKLTSSCRNNTIILNNNLSEIIYNSENGSYISVNGQGSEKIFNGYLTGLVTPYGVYPYYAQSSSVSIYNFDTLKNKAYFSYDGNNYSYDIRYVKYSQKQWDTEKISSNSEHAYMSADLKSIAYLKNDKIYYIKNISKNIDDVTDIADDIISFIPSDDLSYFYAIDNEKALKYVDHKNSKKIADDASEYSFVRNIEGHIFFTSDDVLYTTYKDKNKEKINGNECYLVLINNCILFAEYDEETNIYANTTGNKFECIIKDFES